MDGRKGDTGLPASAVATAATNAAANSMKKYDRKREVSGDGFCITHIGSRREFVEKSSDHTGNCGNGAKMVYGESVGHGSAIWEQWLRILRVIL